MEPLEYLAVGVVEDVMVFASFWRGVAGDGGDDGPAGIRIEHIHCIFITFDEFFHDHVLSGEDPFREEAPVVGQLPAYLLPDTTDIPRIFQGPDANGEKTLDRLYDVFSPRRKQPLMEGR
ncbi:MAG: hypothetical protein BECKG1743F_GA0114225_101056 [Candidatus Kentron sp. G]|nr:MAG: hypothetical protein BECKG1743F_GA0114225_101056 [Candidatus Kentron sp. G]